MKIAYLVNQYPKISHVFIRREILAVEREGFEVSRFAIRRSLDVVADAIDVEEGNKTHTLLDAGWSGLLHATLWAALARPLRFLRSLLLTVSVGLSSDRGTARHLVYLSEACLLLRWSVRDGVRHVHAHFGTNSAMVAMLCRELGGPSYSFTAHGPEEFDNAPLLGLRQKIHRASFVAAITSYARSQLFRLCDFRNWPKIKLVRCGVDAQYLGPEPVAVPNTRRLLSIGRLCEQKGQLLLIEALALLQRQGREIELALIGDGELRSDLESAISRHGLVEKVKILGWASSDAIRRALDESCAFVLPSFAEGLPVVIMEAFARARPVLSTFVAGIPELVVPGRNGWLVPAGSVEDLAEGVRQILDTPLPRLQEMGLRGREDVKRLHDIDVVAREMVAHLRTALASAGGGKQS
jgi:glycosyltransferase involved in cell wall biosynthesis